jgi:hypothetical protein
MWRVAANILNKQLRTPDKEWSANLGVGRGEKTPHSKKTPLYEMFHMASDLDGFFGVKEVDMGGSV